MDWGSTLGKGGLPSRPNKARKMMAHRHLEFSRMSSVASSYNPLHQWREHGEGYVVESVGKPSEQEQELRRSRLRNKGVLGNALAHSARMIRPSSVKPK